MTSRVPLYYRITNGVRITARPFYLERESDPGRRHYVFAYQIRIENTGGSAARLRTRRWLIHDEAAGDSVVEGEGVVGRQPRLEPGDVHEYSSYCVLTTTSGWMEGSYHFERDDGSTFEAAIPRFLLSAPDTQD